MFEVVNILDLIDIIGEDETMSLFSDFVSKDKDIEDFIKRNSINFAKKKISMTFVVFSKEDNKILGIFSLANKIVTIVKGTVSKTKYLKLERYAKDTATENSLQLPCILIAQFSKNEKYSKEITGKQLMELTLDTIAKVQHIIGGSAVFLECKDIKSIVNFYTENNFAKFDERISVEEDIIYQRMFTLL